MQNELYLAVLPMIHLGSTAGLTEEILTLFPDKNFATEFFPDEVDMFIQHFQSRVQHLTGGHVAGYDFFKEPVGDGRVIVRVLQNVR